jgi:hypothetical protein
LSSIAIILLPPVLSAIAIALLLYHWEFRLTLKIIVKMLRGEKVNGEQARARARFARSRPPRALSSSVALNRALVGA